MPLAVRLEGGSHRWQHTLTAATCMAQGQIMPLWGSAWLPAPSLPVIWIILRALPRVSTSSCFAVQDA